MTVAQVITEYVLERYNKKYKNVYGNEIDEIYLDFSRKVKDVSINFMNKTATFTVLSKEDN